MTRAQYEAAIKKCGGGGVRGQFNRGGRLKNPAYLAALTKFAACMRENGVNVPAPNTSGNGPIFDTKGIDTHSAQFEAAEKKCQSHPEHGVSAYARHRWTQQRPRRRASPRQRSARRRDRLRLAGAT